MLTSVLSKPIKFIRDRNNEMKNTKRKKTGIQISRFLILPGLIFILLGHFVAPFFGAIYAFTDFTGLGSYHFVGIKNFKEIFNSNADKIALSNTFKLAIPFVILVIVFGLLLALALQSKLKTRDVLRSLFFIPVIMIPLAITQVWKYIFNYNGPLNLFLKLLGHAELCKNWLGDSKDALYCILFVMIWQNVGYAMIIFNAGLQSVPEELYEAAKVDGAGKIARLHYITIPLLAPSFTIVMTLMTISGLRVFDQVIGLTNGGPSHMTETLASDFYLQTWVNGRYGYGSALALILTLLVIVIDIFQIIILRKREENLNG